MVWFLFPSPFPFFFPPLVLLIPFFIPQQGTGSQFAVSPPFRYAEFCYKGILPLTSPPFLAHLTFFPALFFFNWICGTSLESGAPPPSLPAFRFFPRRLKVPRCRLCSCDPIPPFFFFAVVVVVPPPGFPCIAYYQPWQLIFPLPSGFLLQFLTMWFFVLFRFSPPIWPPFMFPCFHFLSAWVLSLAIRQRFIYQFFFPAGFLSPMVFFQTAIFSPPSSLFPSPSRCLVLLSYPYGVSFRRGPGLKPPP